MTAKDYESRGQTEKTCAKATKIHLKKKILN